MVKLIKEKYLLIIKLKHQIAGNDDRDVYTAASPTLLHSSYQKKDEVLQQFHQDWLLQIS